MHQELNPFAIYEKDGKRFNLSLDYDAQSQFPENISAKLVWAAALMAKELNGDYVKRDGKWEYITYYDENGKECQAYEQVKLPNAAVMMGLIYYYPSHLKNYLEEAERLLNETQLDFMFKVLAENAENYEDGLMKVIGKEKVNSRDFGVLAFAPYYAEKKENERAFSERIANSKHFGNYDEKVNIALENVQVRSAKGDYGGWNVTAVTDDGCLVSYFTSKEVLTKQDGWYAVEAKVKSHQLDWKTKTIPETRINYVKLL